MKIFTRILLTIYIIVVSYLAYPMAVDIYETHFGNEKDIQSNQLDAGLRDEQWKFLQDLSELISYADMLGYQLSGGELYRTMYQQKRYVAQGLSWTYNSRHLKRLAVDLNLFIDGKYQTSCEAYEVLGDFWESLDPKNRWGGRWRNKDCPHFERRI